MRILLTGGTGFVGSHVVRALHRQFGAGLDLIITTKNVTDHGEAGATDILALDVTDREAIFNAIARWQPTHVLHLAGIAAPGLASADPELTWRVHVGGALNVAEAILAKATGCFLVHVGSGLIYGESARNGTLLNENALLAPLDDYGVTKAAADLAIGALTRKGLRSVRLRPFNHTGPGQTEDFVVPAFAMQIAGIEKGLVEPVLRVGNLDAERDFLDVRDVAEAYVLAISRADRIEPGTIFNIASGTPYRIGYILDALLALSVVDIRVEQDPARMRPSDIPKIVGDASKARECLGWTPRHNFDQTLRDVLDDARLRVARR
ncbi:MAG: GDP-mannose 4,6-dehydratase [Aquamicrobium sp.]|uniref:GDP-mannose 4,6-dehydratase n=1 Tax=Aquamicrobium sp. TaxID=1872579 RepID=UPI00349E6F37|nr:GDP-mannose 4,6-dehydratase [Aquamicrobium sp.]